MDINLREIEKKWQKKWDIDNSHFVHTEDTKNKLYCLTMFSYPSGDRLHIGHWYNYGPVDTFSRFMKMSGYKVLQPQGFDAFGLPAENFAIKHGIHPKESTRNNIDKMKSQLMEMGAMFDWSKEINTSTPEYYKWTQWLFLQLYKNNLAYRKEAMVNWDPIDQTVLANEQVLSDGTSDRSGALVVQKALKQWFFKITEYADELLCFDDIKWPKKTVLMQKNWIGKSVGALIDFNVENSEEIINIYTTRPDTIFGCTYLVISPEHPLINLLTKNKYKKDIDLYCKNSSIKSELQRMDLSKEKTGVFTGTYVINPVNGDKIPVWTSDYVLTGYGTGAVMAVPGHDQRDFEFALKYTLNILKVVDDGNNISIEDKAFTDSGISINSDFLNGLTTNQSKVKIIKYLEDNSKGREHVNYRLKDWLISRQRYWGTPIPIVYDPKGNPHPIPEKHLPWVLPEDVEYKPKGTSPLGSSKELIKRTEKIFGKGWYPEIDTMDTFVCSSWYYLRYLDSNNNKEPFSKESLKWLPVDYYIGGAEHATMHLLYARFITKVLRDLSFINFNEPFKNLYHQGTITKDGTKMSKSKGNTVSPDKFVETYGSDTFRCYLMFMGPFDEGGDWNDKGIKGIDRFLKRVFRLIQNLNEDTSDNDLFIHHSTIKGVTEDLGQMKFNTAISKLMEYVNNFLKSGFSESMRNDFIKMLAPFAPHLSEELWSSFSENSVFIEQWPKFDETKIVQSSINIVIQVNGKLRGNIDISDDLKRSEILGIARNHENVKKFIVDKEIIKEIYVPGKIVNFVIK